MPVSASVNLQDHIVIGFILTAILITCICHHHFMQAQNIALTKINMLIVQMDLIQCISISGNLRFVVVQWSAVQVDDSSNAFVACNNALNGIGAFDRLYLCNPF